MLLIMLYEMYSIKYYYFIINENNFSLLSQLRQAPTTPIEYFILSISTDISSIILSNAIYAVCLALNPY